MENQKSKVTISAIEGKFEFSGTESFVNEQIEKFRDLIEKSLNQVKIQDSRTDRKIDNKKETIEDKNKTPNQDGIDKYPEVYLLDEENLRIICDIHGSKTSEQTLNCALLYAYGQKLLNNDEANVNEIKDICKDHGFHDTNFSTYIKSGDPKDFMDKGSGKNRSIKITRPGEKKALELINLILENENK